METDSVSAFPVLHGSWWLLSGLVAWFDCHDSVFTKLWIMPCFTRNSTVSVKHDYFKLK